MPLYKDTFPAVDIVNIPAGNIAATDVQTALNELDTEKASLTGAETLTNKTLTNPVINGIPHTVQRFLSGSGTYTTPANCKAIKVRMVGGGGGGGGGGISSTGGVSAPAGNTTFGTSLLTCSGGYSAATISAVGTTVVSSPAINIASSTGAYGGGFTSNGPTDVIYLSGGTGAISLFGGNGYGTANSAGIAALSNTGAGGGGGGTSGTANCFTGAGGGSGGYIEALINSPSATYSYAIGAGSAGGAAGTGGFAGGAGGSGIIIVEEYYV